MLPRHNYEYREEGFLLTDDQDRVKESNVSARCRDALYRYGLGSLKIESEITESIKQFPDLEDDYSYTVTINNDTVTIQAETEWGALAACSSLFFWREGDRLPCGTIEDKPAYPWRGLMLDVARHFMPVKILEVTIEIMALFKLNVLHLHLSDDQGFRFGSREISGLASEDHYSKDELRDLIAFAADRGIRVVPEIDVPGHTHSWLLNHPEWGTHLVTGPTTEFGYHLAAIDPSNQDVLTVVERLFGEIASVFPDAYIHFGGDEVNTESWLTNESICRWMESNGHETIADAQAQFNCALLARLAPLQKHWIAWDEVLHPDLAPNVVVQAWRGMRARDFAIQAGHATIVSAPFYLDLNYPAEFHHRYAPAMSRAEWKAAHLELREDPRIQHVQEGFKAGQEFGEFPDLPSRSNGVILGGEACMWSEIVNPTTLHRRVWSRLPAIADRFWCGKASCSRSELGNRLADVWQKLESLGFENFGVFPLPSGCELVAPLLEALEPLKWYGRHLGPERLQARIEGIAEQNFDRPYKTTTALNRVVDHLPPSQLGLPLDPVEPDFTQTIDHAVRGWHQQAYSLACLTDYYPEDESLRAASAALSELADVWHGKVRPNFRLAGPFGEYTLPIAIPVVARRLLDIAQEWIEGNHVVELPKGHVNDTYVLDEKFVLTRINSFVFTDPGAIIRNYQKIYQIVPEYVAALRQTIKGENYVTTGEGSVWRMTTYHANRNFEILPTELCSEAGRAFGAFLALLVEFPLELDVAIDGFHDLHWYLGHLDSVTVGLENQEELDYVNTRRNTIPLWRAQRQVIHGDCKVNNLLFDPTNDHVVKIVDLDTVMWGQPEWDYGDLVRSTATGASDDALDLSRIKQVSKGFFSQYKIDVDAISSFAESPAHMSFMLGVRFLTDHLSGDRYFKVARHGQNLERAAEQFRLTRAFDALRDDLCQHIQDSLDDKRSQAVT